MAIDVVGSASGVSTTVNLPARLAGDLLLVAALRTSSSSQPSLPVGFTSLYAGNGARVYYQFATADSAASTVFADFTQRSIAVAYRGVDSDAPFGQTEYGNRATRSTITASAMGATDPATNLIAFLMCSNAASTDLTPPPFAGFVTERLTAQAYAGHLTAGTFAGGTATLNASTMSSWAMIGLVPAGGAAPVRRRSPLLLTPW